MLDVQRSTFFSNQGRVAESGLRHSTRNRAWGNPPWVRIPPLPPTLTRHLILTSVARLRSPSSFDQKLLWRHPAILDKADLFEAIATLLRLSSVLRGFSFEFQ